MQALPVPAGTVESQATAVNSSGTAVGYCGITNPSHWSGVVWSGGGYFEIPAAPPVKEVFPLAISNPGWVVGQVKMQPGGAFSSAPFVWNDGQLTVIDPAQFGKTSGIARCVSDSGWVAGTMGNTAGTTGRGFRWKDGAGQILEPLPGADNSIAWAVDERGTAVGSCRFQGSAGGSSTHNVGTVWPPDGPPYPLPLLPGYASAGCYGISNDGVIIGSVSQPLSGPPTNPMVVWVGGVPHNISDLAVPPVSGSGAVAMNRRGQIVGYGSTGGSPSGSAWIATPTGSPADLNRDCAVNGADLMLLLESWGPAGDSPADLNHDGLVDGADLGILLGKWTAQ